MGRVGCCVRARQREPFVSLCVFRLQLRQGWALGDEIEGERASKCNVSG